MIVDKTGGFLVSSNLMLAHKFCCFRQSHVAEHDHAGRMHQQNTENLGIKAQKLGRVETPALVFQSGSFAPAFSLSVLRAILGSQNSRGRGVRARWMRREGWGNTCDPCAGGITAASPTSQHARFGKWDRQPTAMAQCSARLVRLLAKHLGGLDAAKC